MDLTIKDVNFVFDLHDDSFFRGPEGFYVLSKNADPKNIKNYRAIDTISMRTMDDATVHYDVWAEATFDQEEFEKFCAEEDQREAAAAKPALSVVH